MTEVVLRALDDPRITRRDVQTLAKAARALPLSVHGDAILPQWAPLSLGTVMRLAGFRDRCHAARSMLRLVQTGYLERRPAPLGVRARWEYRVRV